MAQKIYLPKSLGITKGPRTGSIMSTAIDADVLDVADWITEAAADGTITISGGGGGAVTSVAGRTGAVVLTKSDVSLANVDNTSDVNKPISSATQTALNAKAASTTVASLNTLTGVAAGSTDLGTFTGTTASSNATIKNVIQNVANAVDTKQPIISVSDDGVSIGTVTPTLFNFTGAGVTATQAVGSPTVTVNIPSGGTTTNTLTGTGSAITSTVNGVAAAITPADGTIEKVIGFTSAGVMVKAVPSSGGAPITTINNGASIKYHVVSGSPVVTFTKAAGITEVVVTGGVIEISRVQVNFHPTNDTDGGGSISVKVPTTQSGSMLQMPIPMWINTQNGSTPESVAFLYRNPATNPSFTVVGGTAGSFITVKLTAVNGTGSSGTIVLNF